MIRSPSCSSAFTSSCVVPEGYERNRPSTAFAIAWAFVPAWPSRS